MKDAIINQVTNDVSLHKIVNVPDHKTGIEFLLEGITHKKYGCLEDINQIDIIGNRVVHGGKTFKKSVIITNKVIKKVRQLVDLAPLHNPHNLKGIEILQNKLPDTPQVAVFDSSFHQTLPPQAYMYGFPYRYYEKFGIRKYGFHGISHQYVAKKACNLLGWDIKEKKIITCHLGNGSSVCAINRGKSIETSMGFTPNAGLLMGTRTGNVDLGALLHIADKKHYSVKQLNKLINKESGLIGITGISSDMRDIEHAAHDEGNQRAQLALDMFTYRVKKHIGAYTAVLEGLDLLVFTGGIGENDPYTRSKICRNFNYLGLYFDENKNLVKRKDCIISTESSKIIAMVITTNEELVIAKDCIRLIKKEKLIAVK